MATSVRVIPASLKMHASRNVQMTGNDPVSPVQVRCYFVVDGRNWPVPCTADRESERMP